MGRDDNLLALTDRSQDRRDEIPETLADAGARFDHEVPAGLDRMGDRLGHLDLARPFCAADAGDGSQRP